MTLPLGLCALDDLGVLSVRGREAMNFLQGQLSQDVTKLDARARIAGLHTPQGRTIAVLRLLEAGPETIDCVLPLELVATTRDRLQKYILRSKVALVDVSNEIQVIGVNHGLRMLRLVARSTTVATEIARDDWRAADIADGLPQVYAATSEAFVAQMLNLDCVDGIALDKGCYTGQEVIARAHYRGRVKRRMQRFRTKQPATIAIGDTGHLTDGRGFRVVDRVSLADGRIEFLAVAPIAVEPDVAAETASRVKDIQPIDVESLPLPYALPV